jgi:hypothetical protein
MLQQEKDTEVPKLQTHLLHSRTIKKLHEFPVKKETGRYYLGE